MRFRSATVLSTAIVAVVGFGCNTHTAAPSAIATGPETTASVTANRLLGSGGCASRGCHGGPANDPATGEPSAKWSNAYTFWMRFDKHTSAYQALQGKPAQTMIDHLRTGQPKSNWKDAAVEPRCLACHVTPQLASTDDPRLLAEGVSCDACHTVPGRFTTEWLGPHQLAKQESWDDEKYTSHGLRRLDTPSRRAESCVGCHVGAPASDGVPVREVTHDMIAAGHPRLNFEYTTYLALMPPHWEEPNLPPGHAAHVWYSGQVEAVRAGLELVADRADRVANGSPIPWPELADWNCYACHHGLAGKRDTWRERRAGTDPARTPGQPVWAGAYLSDPLLQLLDHDPNLTADYGRLRQLAVRAGRDEAGKLRDEARRFRERVAAARPDPPLDPADPEAGQKLVDALNLKQRLADGALSRLDWDDAAHTLYALRAACRCGRPDDPGGQAGRVLERIAGELRLPRNPTVNSPVEYDPASVAQDFVNFAEAYEQRRGRAK